MNYGAIEARWAGSKQYAFSVDEDDDLITILIPKDDKSKKSFAVILIHILYYFIGEEKGNPLIDDLSEKGVPHPHIHTDDFGKWIRQFEKRKAKNRAPKKPGVVNNLVNNKIR